MLKMHLRLMSIVGEISVGKTALLDGFASALTLASTYFSSVNQRLAGRGIKDWDFRVESYAVFGDCVRDGVCGRHNYQCRACPHANLVKPNADNPDEFLVPNPQSWRSSQGWTDAQRLTPLPGNHPHSELNRLWVAPHTLCCGCCLLAAS